MPIKLIVPIIHVQLTCPLCSKNDVGESHHGLIDVLLRYVRVYLQSDLHGRMSHQSLNGLHIHAGLDQPRAVRMAQDMRRDVPDAGLVTDLRERLAELSRADDLAFVAGKQKAFESVHCPLPVVGDLSPFHSFAVLI